MFFIPVQWCNFSKYDSNFVLNWVDTVSKTFDIPVTYFGIHTFDNFKPCENVNKYLTDNAFYTFHISGEEHYMMRYLLFNCLRYLYHTENNNIPGLTMQMMSELGTTNFFLCLLLAHCNNIYNEYWGIGVVERNNFYAIPNPDANLKTYLSHIIKYKTISHNIERLKATKDDLTKFDKLVNEKRFAQLLGEVRLLPKEVIKQKQEQKKPSFKKSNPAFFVKIQDPVQGFAAIGMEQANHIDIIPIEDRIYSKKRSIRTAYAIIVGGTVVFVPTSFYNLWTTISNSELNGENRAIIKSQLFANLIYIDNVAETQQDKKEAQPIKKKWNNFIK
jgi:hypothetical protein